MTVEADLEKVFEADRAARDAEEALLDARPEALTPVLVQAVTEALAEPDPKEASLRLVRLADLCAQVPGPEMADTLIAILGAADPSARTEAGEALLDVAYLRFKEVALAVERALDAGLTGPAMEELPFILGEVHDPDPLSLIARFLEHPEASVVAAAIESLARGGDPAAAPYLEALLDDERVAAIPDLDDAPTLIGELAEAALEELMMYDQAAEEDGPEE